jgi:hypothetical protein
MGRKAKLKKIKKEAASPLENESEPTKFVKKISEFGYRLQNIQRSPELPDRKREPEI